MSTTDTQALTEDDLTVLFWELVKKEDDKFRDSEEAIAACDYFREGFRTALALAQPAAGEATVDEMIALAEALERRRCISIAETVKSGPRCATSAFTAGYELACEEIAHRIEHEEWVLQDPGALPLAGDAPLQGEGK